MKIGVVTFPGSNCDQDCQHAAKEVLKMEMVPLWHRESALPADIRCVIIPGGFSYGDYLRVGAIAHMAPIMQSIKEFADKGGLVIGICNGFQILTESGLLPGALLRNKCLHFLCKTVPLKIENRKAPWTDFEQSVIDVPIAHGDGNYYIDPDGLKRLQDNGQIAFRYSDKEGRVADDTNPNGSVFNIAGITNEKGNVLGMMPHPERCSEKELGNTDGLLIWGSMLRHLSEG